MDGLDQVISVMPGPVREDLRALETSETEEEDLREEEAPRTVYQNGEEIKEAEIKEAEEGFCERYSHQLVIDEIFTSLVQVHSPTGIRSAYKPVKKIFTAFTKDISSYIGGNLETFELLPRNIRFYVSRGDINLFIIEDEPCIRTIRTNQRFESTIENLRLTGKSKEFGYENFLQDMSFVEERKASLRSDESERERDTLVSGETIYRFNLSFPYIVYIVSQFETTYFGLSIYYRTSPLTDLKDLLFKCNLLNIDGRDVCCLGTFNVPVKIPISEKVSIVIGQFWNSIFNTEITENFRLYRNNPHLCTFLHWQHYSQTDPSFILSENFIPVSESHPDLKSVIESKFSSSMNDEEITHNSIVKLLHSDRLPALGKVQRNLLVSASQMIVDADNGITLDCGEEIVVDEKKYYIVNFLASGIGSVVQQIITEDEDHNMKKFKVTKKLVEELIKGIRSKDHLESCEVSGKQVKTGDLINFPEEKRFSTISKLLKDRDGTVLAKCGGDFYILDNIKFNTMTENEITINGVKLQKKEKYFVSRPRMYLPNLLEGEFNLRTFEGLGNSGREEVVFKFSGNYNFNLDEMYRYQFFNESSVEELLISRYGIKLFEKGYRIKNSCLYVSDRSATLRPATAREQSERIVQEKRLFIPSFDFDIDFKIGDKVIVANWSKPELICCIQTITDFEKSDQNVVSIVTVDDSGNVTKTKYIDFNRSTIFTGNIRKISSEFAGIKSGFKMIAKTKVGNFLKKDCHQVIGFLTDTPNGIPLMLCSNLSTLWATENNLNNFNFLDPSSRTFLKFGVSPLDISNIKIQPGDLVYSMKSANCCTTNIFFALNRIFKTVAVLRCQSNYSFCRCPEIARASYSLYGIPNPRFTIKRGLEEEGFERLDVVPSFYNTYMKNNSENRNLMPIWVRKEEIFNVPNLLNGQEKS